MFVCNQDGEGAAEMWFRILQAMIYQHSKDGSYADFQDALKDEPAGPEAKAYR